MASLPSEHVARGSDTGLKLTDCTRPIAPARYMLAPPPPPPPSLRMSAKVETAEGVSGAREDEPSARVGAWFRLEIIGSAIVGKDNHDGKYS